MRLTVVAVGLAVLCGSWAIGQSKSNWKLAKYTDPFTDKEEPTLVLPSEDGNASLRIHCNAADQHKRYVVLLTVPAVAGVDEPALIDLRFDKNMPLAYLASNVGLETKVAQLGGDRTSANFIFRTGDTEKVKNFVNGPDPQFLEIIRVAERRLGRDGTRVDLLKTPAGWLDNLTSPADILNSAGLLLLEMKKASRFVYRFTLATRGNAYEGAFNLAGFDDAMKPMMALCPIDLS